MTSRKNAKEYSDYSDYSYYYSDSEKPQQKISPPKMNKTKDINLNPSKTKQKSKNDPEKTKNDAINEYSSLYYSDDEINRDVKENIIIVDIKPSSHSTPANKTYPQQQKYSPPSIEKNNEQSNSYISSSAASQQSQKPKKLDSSTQMYQATKNDPQFQKAFRDLVDKNKTPPPMFFIPIQRELQRKYIKSLENENYDESERLDSALSITSRQMEEIMLTERHNNEIQEYKERMSASQQELTNKQNEWKKIFAQYQQETADGYQLLMKRHKEEEEDFQKLWGDPSNLVYFNKPSARLLQLRTQQKQLAISKHYAEAKAMKAEVEQLQQIESEEAQKRAVDAMIIAHKAMEDRHQKEIDCFHEKARRTQYFLQDQMKKELLPFEMQIKKIQITLNDEKLLNGKQKRRDTTRDVNKLRLTSREVYPHKDAQTQRAMLNYRYRAEPVKLDISGIDVKTLMQRPPSCIRVTKKKKN